MVGFQISFHFKQNQTRFDYRLREENVQVQKFLDFGSFGRVFEGTYRKKKAAIKVFNKLVDRISDEDLDEITKECELMASLKHQNTVRVFGLTQHDGCIALVMEFATKGSLKKWIPEESFRQNIALQYDTLLGIASGLRFIHLKNIIHRDLKPDNILVFEERSSSFVMKITNFGESRVRFYIE